MLSELTRCILPASAAAAEEVMAGQSKSTADATAAVEKASLHVWNSVETAADSIVSAEQSSPERTHVTAAYIVKLINNLVLVPTMTTANSAAGLEQPSFKEPYRGKVRQFNLSQEQKMSVNDKKQVLDTLLAGLVASSHPTISKSVIECVLCVCFLIAASLIIPAYPPHHASAATETRILGCLRW